MTRDSRRLPPWRSGALLALAVCLAAPMSAQQRPQTAQQRPTFRADVELVQIDVVVVDESGQHVRGLKPADFVVRDRGKAQTVAAFEEIAHERPPREPRGAAPGPSVPLDVSNNQTTGADRLVVMVVDDLHIWQGRTETAKSIARGVLDRLGADASMAVLFTSGDRSTQVTEDRSRLMQAIETLKARQSFRRPNQAVDTQKPRPNDPEAPIEVTLANIEAAQNTNLQQFFDNMTLFSTLETAAQMLGRGDARRKAFVLVTEGLVKNPTGIFGTSMPPGEAPAGGADYAATGDAAATIVPGPTQYHAEALIDMMESMRRANVATYAIDPRGEVTSQELMLESHPAPPGFDVHDAVFRWNNPVRIAQDGLTTIAEASGGFAVVDTDDFTGGIERILDDLDHYYLLGFYPADPNRKGYRRLNVTVPAHPEWTVRFRHGYRLGDEPKPPAESDRLVALSAGVLPKTDLALRLGAVPLASGSDDKVRVAMALEVSAARAALQERDGRLRDELKYEVLAVNDRSQKVTRAGGLTARATLSPAGNGPAPDVATYQVSDTISLEPGTYQLRVSAHSAKLDAGGSVYLYVTVPDFEDDALTIGGLAVGYAGRERVASASVRRPLSPAQRAARMAVPEPPPALPFAPTLDRAFDSTDTLRLYFEIARKDERTPVNGVVEIEKVDGERARLALPFTPAADGRVLLQIPLSGLAPGRYILRAKVTSGAHTAAREIAIEIR